MLALVVGKYCIPTGNTLCPSDKTVIAPFWALVASFVLVGLVGILYLAIRGRRG
jgi:hypothetical protein